MRNLLIIFVVLASVAFDVSAQNYSCVSPEYKTYFTNYRGYLRGMRIDSIKVINGNTVYYPYKSGRVRGLHLHPSQFSFVEDSSAGSWMGEEIIETPNGYTYIQNAWGDTLTIKRHDTLGASWIFFKDTSSVYYVAEIVQYDTITIGNALDSFRRIRLSAIENNIVVPNDSLHNLELMLTKEHGLLELFDFYLFPYPGYFTNPVNADYFFNLAMGGPLPRKDGLTFRKTEYKLPMGLAIFDYQEGDIHKTKASIYDSWSGYTFNQNKSTTIVSKTVTANYVTYFTEYSGVNRWSDQQNSPPPQTFSGSQFIGFNDTLLLDTMKMPEEWGHEMIYYYNPDDTSFCTRSPLYSAHNTMIGRDGYLDNFEPSSNHFSFKEKLGLVYSTKYEFPSRFYDEILVSSGQIQSFCDGNNNPVGIEEEVFTPTLLSIFPNPASLEISVTLATNIEFSVSIMDIRGRTLKYVAKNKSRCVLNTQDLQPGLYFIKISVREENIVKKIVIQH